MSESIGAFVNDWRLQQLVLYLLRSGCTAFVETGTFRGDTSNWVARNSEKPVYTCEVNQSLIAQSKLDERVHQSCMSSPQFLRIICQDVGRQPLFFLDAHWLTEWPLRDEIKVIGEQYSEAIMIAHDFVVPKRENFIASAGGGGEPRLEHQRDVSKDEMPTLEYIQPRFNPSHKYEWLYPSYNERRPGYIVLFQNVAPRGSEYLSA